MEIQVPEHPIITWKQFFVHMGTIVLGLLIAISLEQSVEWLHHRHQRHQLVEDMRDEAERNIAVIDEDSKALAQEQSALRSIVDRLNSAPVENGYAFVDIATELRPQSQIEKMTSPSRGTWAVALASSLVPLLTHEQARIYTRLDFEADQELKAEDEANLRYNALIATMRSHRGTDGSANRLRLSPLDREQALQTLHGYITAQTWVLTRLAFWKGASEAITHGVTTEEEMMPYVKEAAKDASR